jgi:hypothetical protein
MPEQMIIPSTHVVRIVCISEVKVQTTSIHWSLCHMKCDKGRFLKTSWSQHKPSTRWVMQSANMAAMWPADHFGFSAW